MRFLVSLKGIDVNKPDTAGITPLMAATASRHVNAIKLLLRVPEIEPNRRDKHGMTAFHFAIRSLSNAVVGEFVASPLVDRDIKDNAKVCFSFRSHPWTMSANTICFIITRVWVDDRTQHHLDCM
jgi:ankyrin repeat protein